MTKETVATFRSTRDKFCVCSNKVPCNSLTNFKKKIIFSKKQNKINDQSKFQYMEH